MTGDRLWQWPNIADAPQRVNTNLQGCDRSRQFGEGFGFVWIRHLSVALIVSDNLPGMLGYGYLYV